MPADDVCALPETTASVSAASRDPMTGEDAAGPRLDYAAYAQTDAEGVSTLHLMVEGIHCAGCVQRIERVLNKAEGVVEARVNMTTRRLVLRWQGDSQRAAELVARASALGFTMIPYEPARLTDADKRHEKNLLVAMAVAGFAAANVMLLSVSVWSGGEEMGPATRGLMHWISALIALPTVAFSGRPFFYSALGALRSKRMNMDVPISLAVILAAGMSLFETIRGGEHVYFDSAVTLLFFLLIGRFLDGRARGRARSAAERLLALGGQSVTVLDADGNQALLRPEQVEPGMVVLAATGDRVAVDGLVRAGESDLDTSLITGESVPQTVSPGDPVYSGTINLTAPLRIEVTAVGEGTLLAEIVRLMEAAEQRKARYVTLADRIARIYAPAVHIAAGVTFLGWWLLGGSPWQAALLYAVAVLIITCPCALGLAVPAVQVIGGGRLMRQGIFLKTGTALERMATVDMVVFDKTGTLTEGHPIWQPQGDEDPEAVRLAVSMAGASRHPLARALCHARPGIAVAEGVKEIPGNGLSLMTEAGEVRLGNRNWCQIDAAPSSTEEKAEGGAGVTGAETGPELWLVRPDAAPLRFRFTDALRSDARAVIDTLRRQGKRLALLSGDREATVAEVAGMLGIEDWQAGCSPADKCARLEAWAKEGHKVLMVGDGLNDAPALASAHVSVSPSSAADISQTAADAVFQGRLLAPVLELLDVAKRSEQLVKQNFGLAFSYNIVTVPLAMAGFVTPLIAAVAMSSSSLVVTGNALRLNIRRRLMKT